MPLSGGPNGLRRQTQGYHTFPLRSTVAFVGWTVRTSFSLLSFDLGEYGRLNWQYCANHPFSYLSWTFLMLLNLSRAWTRVFSYASAVAIIGFHFLVHSLIVTRPSTEIPGAHGRLHWQYCANHLFFCLQSGWVRSPSVAALHEPPWISFYPSREFGFVTFW